MIKINLIGEARRPTAVRKKRDLTAGLKKENLGNYLLVLGALLGVVALGTEYWMLNADLKSKQDTQQRLQRQYDALKPIIKEVNEFKDKTAELEQKIEIIKNLKVNQRGPVEVMDSVSRALPELVWLTRMNIGSSRINLRGQARNENAVANFVENLDLVPNFNEPTLIIMRETRGGLFNFELRVDYSLKKPEEEGEAEGREPRT
ncbi:MAG: PilN domain-containing protein [Acidobacteriota bacterium]